MRVIDCRARGLLACAHDANARAEDGIAWLGELVEAMAIPRLASYGVAADDIPRIVEQARRASSMQGNPITLTDDELAEALSVAIQAAAL